MPKFLPKSVSIPLFYGLLWLFFGMIQLGFIASLPSPLVYTPFLFLAGVYFIERGKTEVGIAWMISFGLLLDGLRVSDAPLDTVSYAAAAFCAYFLVKKIFSHRSFFGTIAISFGSLIVLSFSEILFSFLYWMVSPEKVVWIDIVHLVLWRGVFLAVLLVFLLLFARRIRAGLEKVFVISRL